MKTLIESEIPLLINIYLKHGENKFYTSLRVKLNIFTFELFSPKMYTGVFYLAGGHLSSEKNKKISIIILSFKFLKESVTFCTVPYLFIIYFKIRCFKGVLNISTAIHQLKEILERPEK